MFCHADKFSMCPACGERDCAGHFASSDPYGWGVVAAHNAGHHAECDPRGCDEWSHVARPCHPLRDADTGRVLSMGVV